MNRPAVPRQAGDITAAWLSQALSAGRGTPVAVRSVVQDGLVHGSCTKVRLRLEYDAGGEGLPAVMWAKAGWEAGHDDEASRLSYAKEALFYGQLAGATGVRAPASYYADWDRALESIVLMEDFASAGFDLWECTVPRPAAEVRGLLDSLARLHARWWNDAALLEVPLLGLVATSSAPEGSWPRVNGARRLREIMDAPRCTGVPDKVKDPERIERAYWRMAAEMDRLGTGCMVHGDMHPGNCFTDAQGAAGMYDWQTVSRGHWAFDVSYIMVTALGVEERRQQERSLLDHYIARLQAHGVATPPSAEAAWRDYRRYIAHPLMIWPGNFPEYQAEENIQAMTFRLMTAAGDFGFFDLWEV